MSFKIRPNHERIFNAVQSVGEDQPPQEELVEETVFLVDEETGEIVEERQMVPRENVAPVVVAPQTIQPQKETKFIGLSMRKKTKASFM